MELRPRESHLLIIQEWGPEDFVMLGVGILRMWTMTLSSIAINQDEKQSKQGTREDWGGVFKQLGVKSWQMPR